VSFGCVSFAEKPLKSSTDQLTHGGL
jgi:hypothetical protein